MILFVNVWAEPNGLQWSSNPRLTREVADREAEVWSDVMRSRRVGLLRVRPHEGVKPYWINEP